jgi:hypothetical protein
MTLAEQQNEFIKFCISDIGIFQNDIKTCSFIPLLFDFSAFIAFGCANWNKLTSEMRRTKLKYSDFISS